jgi:pimeloyl-ACP methyl ester carboxylesterase
LQIIRKIFRAIGVLLLLLVLVTTCFRLAAVFREDGVPDEIAPAGGRFIEVSDARIFLQEQGPKNGQPVMLVHGTGAWSGLWEETAAVLSDRGYRTLAVDLPPFGFSELRGSNDYTRTAQARRLAELVDALGGRRPILVGHSYGGGPAGEFALREPQKLRKLVLVDAALGIGEAAGTPLPLPLRSQSLREVLVSMTAANPLMTRRILSTFIHLKDRALPKYVAVLSLPLGKRNYTESVASWLPNLLTVDVDALSAKDGPWRKLDLSVEVLWGDKDTVTPLTQAEHLASLLPRGNLTILREVGHIPQVEAPKIFQGELLRALSDRMPHQSQLSYARQIKP